MSQPEKRQYVRIEDRLMINICCRRKAETEQDTHAPTPNHPLEQLAYQFQYLDNQFGANLHRLRAKNNDLAEALNLLNQKINVAFQGASKQSDNAFYTYLDVSISACGLSVPIDHPSIDLQPGQAVRVSLLLPPFNSPFAANGRVIASCEDNDQRLRIGFEDLRTDQEETLIQYVIRRQNAQLVQARERKLQQDD